MIDIEKEREWWSLDDEARRERATRCLDELEATQRENTVLKSRLSQIELAGRRIVNALTAGFLPTGNSDVESAVSREIARVRAHLDAHLAAVEASREALSSELGQLRAQLADQRARDIRMMAHVEMFLGDALSWEGAMRTAAEDYDRLAAIPVPPVKEVES